MRYQEITIDEIALFLRSDVYKNSKNIPITQQRALSQIKNPRAGKNDVALIIALDKTNQIVGFIGMLPEKIPNHPEIKLAWNSCWWVDPKKGKESAIPLFLKFLKAYDKQVMFRDLTSKTEQILMRFKLFNKVKKLNGYRYFLRLNSKEILTKRNRNWLFFSPVLTGIDFVANTILHFKNELFLKDFTTSLQVETCKNIDDEAGEFITKHQKKELFQRGKAELNWIINNPWIIKKSLKEENQHYYFSDANPNFSNHIFKLYDTKHNLVAVLFLTNVDGLVKLPYVYYESPYLEEMISFIFSFLIEAKANSVLIFNEKLNQAFQNRKTPFFYVQKIEKDFVVSKKILPFLPKQFVFQDGEGDFVFT